MLVGKAIRNKTILEIGCGKGEFLVLMCELGDNRGIGIDPSYQPHRTPEEFKHARPASSRIITTRNTPISPPMSSSAATRSSTSGRTGEFIAFDSENHRPTPRHGRALRAARCRPRPQGRRILGHLLRALLVFQPRLACPALPPNCRFDIVELERCYDDQYLLIGAARSRAMPAADLPLEDDLDEMRDACHTARRDAGRMHRALAARLIRDLPRQGKKVVLWIAFSKAVAFLTTLGLGNAVEFVVDINPLRQNKFMPGTGHEIVPPQFLADTGPTTSS